MKFGDFWHLMHHAHDVLDIANEKLKEGVGTSTTEETARYVAFSVATEERVKEMALEEKIRVIQQACEVEEIEKSIVARGYQTPLIPGLSKDPNNLGDLVDKLTQQLLFTAAFLLAGLPLPKGPQ